MHLKRYRCTMIVIARAQEVRMATTRRCSIVLLTLLAAGCTRSDPETPAAAPSHSLAVVNARIWTGEPAAPWAEALLIDGERLTFVGSNEQAKQAGAAKETIDARGRLVVPGFIDSHVHFVEGGQRLASVQLRDAKTRDEFVKRIAAFAATVPEGTWITGGDWDHSLWGGELPTRDWIDAVTTRHPVWVNRLDGHMSLANSAALRAAGVTAATVDVAGGEIVRGAKREPTGVLKDNAKVLVDAVVPTASDEIEDRSLAAAMKYVNERGVTSVHHMGSWNDVDTFARAAKRNALTTRIYAAVPLAEWTRLKDAVSARDLRRRRRSRRKLAQNRRAQGFHGRISGVAHRGVLRAVCRCTQGSWAAREST